VSSDIVAPAKEVGEGMFDLVEGPGSMNLRPYAPPVSILL
jgi:hypothetical protein